MSRTRRWGLLCPEDGGILLSHPDWGDRLWCPSNGHGGNGRFFDPATVQEGYETDMPAAGLTEKQEAALREAKAAPVTKPAARPARAERPARETTPGQRSPRDCECGCGAQTKGGRFIPGHDAKLHARQRAEAKAAAAAAPVPGQQAMDGGEI